LGEPSVRQGGYRDDFFLKLMAAGRSRDPVAVTGVLARQRAYLLSELRSRAEFRRDSGDEKVAGLPLAAAELHVRADLGLIEATEETDWTAAPRTTSTTASDPGSSSARRQHRAQ
jgi:hypothetical protein